MDSQHAGRNSHKFWIEIWPMVQVPSWLGLAKLEHFSENIFVSTNQHFDRKTALAKDISVTEIHIQKYTALWARWDSC